MGKQVTLAMKGRLQLSIDGSTTPRPLDVAIEDIRLDLDYLMENGMLKLDEDPNKVNIELRGVLMRLTIDADEVLSRGGAAIVAGIEGL